MRPLIGITVNEKEYEGIFLAKKAYAEAIVRAGGTPLLLPPLLDDALIEAYARTCQGVLLSGGGDITPAYFQEEAAPGLEEVSLLRDYFELGLADWAHRLGVPILGICRGCLLLNVAAGGSVLQHLPDSARHQQLEPRHRSSHAAIFSDEAGALSRICGAGRIAVNSFHHQAVGRLGEGIVVAARAPDGVIEAIAWEGEAWSLGVQWHPESLPDAPSHRLFSYFVAQAAARL
jgi:putative glutamine amidotransferase